MISSVKCPFCGGFKRPLRFKSCYFIICNKCDIYAILNSSFEIERVKGFNKTSYRLRFS